MTRVNRALEFPAARRDPESGYTLHGRRFDDPYDWLERLDDVETQGWVAAQEAVTHAVLRAVPGRDWLREAVARSARYARLSPPIPAGQCGREFLWQADADDDKLKLMMRRGRAGQLETVLNPNTWASDEALVFAVPSPDGTLVAFGKALGGTHDAVIHVLEVETGRPLPTGRAVRSTGTCGDPMLRLLCGRPSRARYPRVTRRRGRIYDPRRWRASARILATTTEAILVFVEIASGAASSLGLRARQRCYLLRLADDVSCRSLPPCALTCVQVIGDSLLVHTDLDAPRGRLCVASLTAPTEWRTLIPEGADTCRRWPVGGRLTPSTRAASHRVRSAEDGSHLRDLEPPALGPVNRNEGDGDQRHQRRRSSDEWGELHLVRAAAVGIGMIRDFAA
jgi:prolyl oligopeptidase